MVKHGNFKFAQVIFTFDSSFVLWPLNSVDRLLAAHLHLRYQELMTHKRIVAAVISIWTLCTLQGHQNCFRARKIRVVIIFEVCFIITGIAIYRIYFTVRRHKNQLQVQQIEVAQNSQMEILKMLRGRENRLSVHSTYFLCFYFVLCQPIALWLPFKKAETHDATNRCDTSPRQVAATNRLV